MSTDTAYETTQRAADQVREFGERATGTGRAFGQLALDAYEQVMHTFLEFEHRAAEAAPVDWVGAAIGAHASFVEDLTSAYVKAARSVLS
jgi:hypothetical protein